MDYHSKGLERAIAEYLRSVAQELGVDLSSHSAIKDVFLGLIDGLAAGGGARPVILVDEYDKPIIDYIDDPARMDANRAVLKRFYGVLKDAAAKLETVFITGVSAFSQVSIFSDLNHLTHLTLDSAAATLVGITQTELEDTFSEYLADVDRDRLREWYNGYSWDGLQRVYNPWSLLTFLRTKQYQNYWFQTGTPTFLVKLMRERGIYEPDELYGSTAELLSFDTQRLNPTSILFQTGYLTLAAPMDEAGNIDLDYPNREVRQSLDMFLLQEYTDSPRAGSRALRLHRAFSAGDVDAAFGIANATLAEVPYDHWAGQDEHFFHAIFFLMFRIAGVPARSEVHTARGRCDVLIEVADYVYAIEFKLDGTVAEALAQVRERRYLDPYGDDERAVLAVGASVSTDEKAIVAWETEPYARPTQREPPA